MKILYSKKCKSICTDLKAATRFFGGDKKLAEQLMSRLAFICQAETIKDIIVMPTFRFHALRGQLEGLFAIDVRSSNSKWRLILEPLDENEKPFIPCRIDEIADIVTIVSIVEVSAHYE